MVDDFGQKHKTPTKNYVWLANLRQTEAEFYEKFVPQIGPSTQLINATSFILMRNATIGAKELGYISIYQTLLADKN